MMRRQRNIRTTGAGIVVWSAMSAVVLAQQAGTSGKLEDSVVFSMTGGPAQEVMQKCAADDFTKKTNVRVEFVSMQAPQALARVLVQRNSPTMDVMWSIPATDYSGFKEGVFVPLTVAQVPNIANIDTKFPPELNRGPLVSTSIQGIQYNTKVFKDKGLAPPTSWRDLWDPKYKGYVGIQDVAGGSGQAILAIAGHLNGGDSKNFDKAFEYLAHLRPNLYAIFNQAPQFDAAMLDGSAWFGITAAARPLAMMLQGSPISFVQPVEGVVTANISLSVVKGAPHPNAAIAFVNWMLSKEAQSCLLRAGYPPVVKGVEVPANMVPYMTVQRDVIPVDWAGFQDKLPDILKRWQKEVEGK